MTQQRTDLVEHIKVNKEIAEQWVTALRSGKYEQGVGQLFDGEKYCCLGVLCDIYATETHQGKWWEADEDDYGLYYFDAGLRDKHGMAPKDEYLSDVPPLKVRKWAGMENKMGVISPSKQTLTQLNDDGNSFKKIAKVIEKNWEAL
jgi:hypothetical protein